MMIKLIKSNQDLENALKRVDELWDVAETNTPEGDELEALALAIEAYETDLMNNEALEFDNIFEVLTNDDAERLKKLSDKLILQRE